MEKVVLYTYLNYIKKSKKDFKDRLKSIPWRVVILFIVSAVLWIASLVVLFAFEKEWLSLALMLACVVVLGIFYHYSESYKARICHKEYVEYKQFCCGLRNELRTINICTLDDVVAIRDRLRVIAEDNQKHKEASDQRFDKWTQTLVIPAVLALLSAVISKQDDVQSMMTYMISILIVFGTLYSAIYFVSFLNRISDMLRNNQLKELLYDLQGVLDFFDDTPK